MPEAERESTRWGTVFLEAAEGARVEFATTHAGTYGKLVVYWHDEEEELGEGLLFFGARRYTNCVGVHPPGVAHPNLDELLDEDFAGFPWLAPELVQDLELARAEEITLVFVPCPSPPPVTPHMR